jgi:hypothetical protein
MSTLQVYRSAKTLKPHEKAKLVDLLLADLDVSDPAVSEAWDREAGRRLDEIRSGAVRTIPWTTVQRRRSR